MNIIVLLILCGNVGYSQNDSEKTGKIEGIITLDSIWSNKIYLSNIPDFGKMYTMSKSMIIAETTIDSSGHFSFDTNYLPSEDNLYRIHITKKNSSPASIIIGGKDENHFFIIANKYSTIAISNNNTINSIEIRSSTQNQIIRKIDVITNYIDSTNFNESRIKSDFVEKAFNEQIRQIADTCSYPLTALYALKKSKFESNISTNLEFYQNFLEKWENENSAYFQSFRETIPKQKKEISSNFYYFGFLLLAFLSGLGTNYFYRKQKNKNSNLLKTLSVQERKILTLLQQGKSNKEISEEHSIGISTVKSHVSNILNKLEIKSRKDVLDL